MRARYFGLVLTGTAVSVMAGLAATAVPVASAASAQALGRRPAWRIVRILRNCGDDSMSSVTALSAKDAWAVGATNGAGPACGADVEHWSGSGWRQIRVPRNTDLALTSSQPLAASSAKDAWIFPAVIGHIRQLYYQYNEALQWNGSRWRRSRFPVNLIVSSAAAVSPSQIWAFGQYYGKRSNVIPYTARYNGRAWHRVNLPIEPVATLGPAPGGIWAFGPTLSTASRPVNKQVLLLLRWNGRSWRTLRVPRIKAPEANDWLSSAYAAAAGPSNVWVAYQAVGHRSIAPVVLLHWNHSRWHRVTVPKAVTFLSGMSLDGRGGIWLLDGEVLNQVWYDYHIPAWTSQPVPSPSGYSSGISGMAWIPGTTSALAVGEADSNTRTVGVVYRYTR